MKRTEIKRYPLSDTTIEKLEPEDKEYLIHDGQGLYLRVRPNGNKDWRFRYKNELNKWAWKGLGGYPKISGKLARTKAQELRDLLADGQNIHTVELSQSYALVDLINEWLVIHQKQTATETYKTNKGRLYKHIIPYFGNRDYQTITPQEWLAFLQERQENTGHYEVIQRVCNLCSNIYTYAKLTKKTITHNPLDDISRYLVKGNSQNYPHIEQHEIPQLINDIFTYPTEQGRYVLLLMMLNYCRPSELVKAKWSEFDLDNGLWTVPADRMKTRKEFIRPLARQSIEILHKLKRIHGDSPYIFPNTRDKSRCATIEFIEKALHRLGYKGKQSPHGFRHIASTYINNHTKADGTKWDSRIIEFSLAHTVHGVKGVYNKAEYLDDRRALAQWYADEILN